MAIGENPSLNILNNAKNLQKQVIKRINENPNILTERYILKSGKIQRL